jgi:hypothetical protein
MLPTYPDETAANGWFPIEDGPICKTPMLLLFCNNFSVTTTLEVPVYFLKAKRGYTVRKMEKGKWI